MMMMMMMMRVNQMNNLNNKKKEQVKSKKLAKSHLGNTICHQTVKIVENKRL